MSSAEGRGRYRSALLATSLLAGCGGSSVALDGDERFDVAAGGADSDGVVVRQLREVGQIAVDDLRLYWHAGHTYYGCLKSSCASSLVNYYTFEALPDPEPPNGGFSYWFAPQGGDLVWTTPTSVLSCPSGGCDGTPHELGASRPAASYAIDDTKVVALDRDGLYTMPRKGGEWSRLVGRSTPTEGRVGTHGGYIYWTEQGSDAADGKLVRLAEDGAGAVEVVSAIAAPTSVSRLAFDSTFAYFTDPRESGGVFRCPLAGCNAGAEDVLGALRSPDALAADDRGLCVRHAAGAWDFAVSCSEGAGRPLEQTFIHANEFAMDGDYLYAAHGRSPPGTPYIEPRFDISREAR